MIIKSGEFDLRGYEIVRTQFFASAGMTSVSFSKNGIRFSSACIRNFVKTEYIEIRVHPFKYAIAVLPCSEHHKNKRCWARMYANGIRVRVISAKAYLGTLYEIFDWDWDKRYRLRGEIIQTGCETIALFNARTPEIFTSRHDMTMPWITGFGDDYYSHRESKLSVAMVKDVASEYNSEPELYPTTQEEADNHIRSLIEKMQIDERNSNA